MGTDLAVCPSRRQYMPNPHFMLSVRNQNLAWWKALAELIDNAFDHGATRVVINCSKDVVEVQDDGTGMKDIASAITFGEHTPGEKTTLGMYGVGLKDAWLATGDKIEIVSVHNGVRSSLTVDINDFDDQWYGPAPTSEEALVASGTTIRLHLRKQRNQPGVDVWATLAWAFTPALRDGRQIVHRSGRHKKKTLAAVSLPKLTDRVCESFEIGGKSVSIDIGIMAEGERMERGPFWVIYGHRILRGSGIGAKGFSTLRIAGTITLGKGWAVTKNKDDLADYSVELEEGIHSRILPLLQQAEQLTQDIESTALKTELESMLNSAVGDAKREARNANKRDTVGTVEPMNTGRRRRNATMIHELPGSVTASGGTKRRGITLGWCNLDDSEMGRYDNLSSRIDLNLDNPFVASVKQSQNTAALYSIAVALLSEYLCTHKDGGKTLFEVESFGKCYGLIMKSVRIDHGDRK